MDRIKQVLKYYYNMEVTNIHSQQGGWASLAYKVSNEKHSYFLKIYEKSRASTPILTKRIDAYVPVIDWLYRNSFIRLK
ncbi:hypothetical protein [Gracilibacillus saliphilus]|uniref:hypothetical protein n=1 Tax=Gracilibacillus saliphilus TaxID=543890 RepID=UPI00307F1BAB